MNRTKPKRTPFPGLRHPRARHWQPRLPRGVYILLCRDGTAVYVGKLGYHGPVEAEMRVKRRARLSEEQMDALGTGP